MRPTHAARPHDTSPRSDHAPIPAIAAGTSRVLCLLRLKEASVVGTRLCRCPARHFRRGSLHLRRVSVTSLARPIRQIGLFPTDTRLEAIHQLEAMGGDPIQRMLECHGVPQDLVTDDMTVGDVGELAVYIKQLTILSESLRPPRIVTVHDVPPRTLPSYVVEHSLAKSQRKAGQG